MEYIVKSKAFGDKKWKSTSCKDLNDVVVTAAHFYNKGECVKLYIDGKRIKSKDKMVEKNFELQQMLADSE